MSDDRRDQAARRAELERALRSADERERWAEDDPSRLFGLLALQETPQEQLDALSERVEAALDALEPAPAMGRPLDVQQPAAAHGSRATRRWYLGYGAAAAVLLLGVLVSWQATRQGPSEVIEVADGPVGHAPAERIELPPIRPGASDLPPFLTQASSPGVQVLDSPGEAQVVDFAVGDMRVVMIFDEALEL